jgi:hypothetical protein
LYNLRKSLSYNIAGFSGLLFFLIGKFFYLIFLKLKDNWGFGLLFGLGDFLLVYIIEPICLILFIIALLRELKSKERNSITSSFDIIYTLLLLPCVIFFFFESNINVFIVFLIISILFLFKRLFLYKDTLKKCILNIILVFILLSSVLYNPIECNLKNKGIWVTVATENNEPFVKSYQNVKNKDYICDLGNNIEINLREGFLTDKTTGEKTDITNKIDVSKYTHLRGILLSNGNLLIMANKIDNDAPATLSYNYRNRQVCFIYEKNKNIFIKINSPQYPLHEGYKLEKQDDGSVLVDGYLYDVKSLKQLFLKENRIFQIYKYDKTKGTNL